MMKWWSSVLRYKKFLHLCMNVAKTLPTIETKSLSLSLNQNPMKMDAVLNHSYTGSVFWLTYDNETISHRSEVSALGQMTEMKSIVKESHPYRHLLDKLVYPNKQLQFEEAVLPEFENRQCKLVSTESDLTKTIAQLKQYSELGVDVEFNHYHSYQGVVCLIQISTEENDYMIDTIALKSIIDSLNEVFTDMNILKIFHAIRGDVGWLQKHLGIYVVNAFDTEMASRLLGHTKSSLVSALQTYCNVEISKRDYQRADWRIRPLPIEMIEYAQKDSCYLIYIYKKMKNKLLKMPGKRQSAFMDILENCRLACLKVHKQTEGNPFRNFIRIHSRSIKSLSLLNDEQNKLLLKAIIEWREKLAMELDESPSYLLPPRVIYAIVLEKPRELNDLLNLSDNSLISKNTTYAKQILTIVKNSGNLNL